MVTIPQEIKVSGKGLMKGLECNVHIIPSDQQGIRFYFSADNTPVCANLANVVSTQNCVILGNDNGVKIVLVEHFMAACAFAGIDSLDVYIDSPELPIFDGSSLEWHNIFSDAVTNHFSREVRFHSPVYVSDKKADIIMVPAEELKITYCVDFDHPELKNKWISLNPVEMKQQILEARTYGYLKDLDAFQKAGMALGVTEENTVGLTETGYTTDLRSEYEPIKHKILDLIGDLFLLGINPLDFKAHIIAKNAGHRSHIEFARQIAHSLTEKILIK